MVRSRLVRFMLAAAAIWSAGCGAGAGSEESTNVSGPATGVGIPDASTVDTGGFGGTGGATGGGGQGATASSGTTAANTSSGGSGVTAGGAGNNGGSGTGGSGTGGTGNSGGSMGMGGNGAMGGAGGIASVTTGVGGVGGSSGSGGGMGGSGAGGGPDGSGQWDAVRSFGCSDEAGVAANGDVVHLIKRCNGDLHYIRSTDQGATWASAVTLAEDIALYLQDPIASLGEDVFIVYFRVTTTVYDFLEPRVGASRPVGDLYFRRSRDGGATWGEEVPLTSGALGLRMGMDIDPAGLIHIAFMDYRAGDFEPDGDFGTWDVRYLRGEVQGPDIAWTDRVLLSGTDSFGFERPAIKALGEQVHLVWMHPRLGLGDCAANDAGVTIPACPGVGYLRSPDGGITWPSTGKELTTNYSNYASRPSLAVVPPATLVVAFDVMMDETDNSGLDAYVTTSDNAGESWLNSRALTNSSGDSTHGFASSNDDTAWVVWHDTLGGELQTHLRESFDGGKTWCPTEQVSTLDGSNTPLMAGSDGYLHVVWLQPGGIGYRRRSLASSCRGD